MLSLIEKTNDGELLALLKEDLVFYGNLQDADITDGLSDEQIKELHILTEENETTDSHSLSDFKNPTNQWRTT
ncbi:MAG: hypothetical protein JWP81_4515 [Ferruginibacter sp.]|nr:hypothetical protein [Ferruginibacter sp.]